MKNQINRLEPQREEIIDMVKRRLALDVNDPTFNELIGSYVDEVGWAISNYIQNPKIPHQLSFVWAAMVASAVSTEQMSVIRPEKDVSIQAFNIKIGDTSIAPASSGGSSSPGVPSVTVIDEIVHEYSKQLERFRRMVWRF